MERETARMRGASSVPLIHKDHLVGEAARLLAQSGSLQGRLQAFCECQVDHIAPMDGFRVSFILGIRECAGETGAAVPP